MHINGDVKFAKIGKFVAVFGAKYTSKRQMVSKKGTVVKNIRGGIYPIAYMLGRKKLKEV